MKIEFCCRLLEEAVLKHKMSTGAWLSMSTCPFCSEKIEFIAVKE